MNSENSGGIGTVLLLRAGERARWEAGSVNNKMGPDKQLPLFCS